MKAAVGGLRNLRSLQMLRALAATSVVYSHIGVVPGFGSFGVDIFFVISGFVMAMVISNGQGPYVFAASRLARITPLYWLLTSCTLVVAVARPELLNSTAASAVGYFKSLFFIPFFNEKGVIRPMLGLGWTLNYEMLFYTAIWLSVVVARKYYLSLTVLMLVFAYVIPGHLSSSPLLRAFFGETLIFEFLFGMLAYEIYRRKLLEVVPALALSVVAVGCYCYMAVTESLGAVDARLVIFGVPSIALVLALTALEAQIMRAGGVLCAAAASMGDASYATYLCHPYVIFGIQRVVHKQFDVFDPYSPFGVVVGVSSALAAGQLLYVFVDRPLSGYVRGLLVGRRSGHVSTGIAK